MVEKDLDKLLKQRVVPHPRSHLAERIIDEAAARGEKATKPDFAKWLGAFFDGFILPQPAVAMAAVLVLGLFIGMGLDAAAQAPEAESLVAYLDIDNGEWS